jgi:hypothetical protein
MSPKTNPPSIKELAFDCPHCGAYTSHDWFDVYANVRTRKDGAPTLVDDEFVAMIVNDKVIPDDTKSEFSAQAQLLLQGFVLVDKRDTSAYANHNVTNLNLSKCYVCEKVSVWVRDRVVAPAEAQGPQPNPDLPDEIAFDFKEAARIVGLSPRGAAALLRLAIQKLCIALGEKGKSIDEDIASLVEKGLKPMVQQALDAVRVIGNEAVHPGALDLKDDVETAMRLFDALNIIAEQMITSPKHMKELYEKLPEAKRKAIDKRDGRSN